MYQHEKNFLSFCLSYPIQSKSSAHSPLIYNYPSGVVLPYGILYILSRGICWRFWNKDFLQNISGREHKSFFFENETGAVLTWIIIVTHRWFRTFSSSNCKRWISFKSYFNETLHVKPSRWNRYNNNIFTWNL